ncbi:MAG: hypothetical protein H8E76_05990, partial [Helicobacteraceae bacterium]|nr:hypothetical protein [Candidatus Sulfurimonas ponti]
MIPENIRYYDEVLTMSAYMASFTHDNKWIERYEEAVLPLENTLAIARKTFPEIIIYLDEIEEEVDTLISLERQSFELLKEDRFKEAQALLFSEKYNESKKEYNKVSSFTTLWLPEFTSIKAIA